jgi:hypothetical protein
VAQLVYNAGAIRGLLNPVKMRGFVSIQSDANLSILLSQKNTYVLQKSPTLLCAPQGFIFFVWRKIEHFPRNSSYPCKFPPFFLDEIKILFL